MTGEYRILKYECQNADELVFTVPAKAKPLKLTVSPTHQGYFNLHCRVPTSGSGGRVKQVTYRCFSTGEVIPTMDNLAYEDTLMDGALYWHIFRQFHEVIR